MASERNYVTTSDGKQIRTGVYMASGIKWALLILAVFCVVMISQGKNPASVIRDTAGEWQAEYIEDAKQEGTYKQCSSCGQYKEILGDETKCLSCEFDELVQMISNGGREGHIAGAIVCIVYGVPVFLLAVLLIGGFLIDGYTVNAKGEICSIWRVPVMLFVASLIIAVLVTIIAFVVRG